MLEKKINKPYQRIFFGAPGTGKSFKLNKEAKKYFGNNYERVTFHPNYMYGSFVGTYKPAMKRRDNNLDEKTKNIIRILKDEEKSAQERYDELYDIFKAEKNLSRLPILMGLVTDENFNTREISDFSSTGISAVERNHGKGIRKFVDLKEEFSENNIVYKYVPGPFMRIYVEAIKSLKSESPEPYLLIIEEINRANVAAVFGDVFQLLDRDEKGESEYPIQDSEDIRDYLSEELGAKPKDYSMIKIPSNMYIWATMNSADQGVMPMDTAFKRRWEFEYLGINDAVAENAEDFKRYKFKISKDGNELVNWDEFRRKLNKKLSTLGVAEDKLIGPYFISKSILEEKNLDKLTDTIRDKVLMYLYEDAAKAYRSLLFAEGKHSTYSELRENFDKDALNIFKGGLEIETELLSDNKDYPYDNIEKSGK